MAIKFPYGLADFYKIRTEGYFYADRTQHIRSIEENGSQLIFLRPRRFGKSLWLSTLENYYDLNKANQFEKLFGTLAIGQHPTPRRNHYFILRWDFSLVSPNGDLNAIRQSLHDHINDAIRHFGERYAAYLPRHIEISPDNAISSFQDMMNVVQLTSHRVYLLIDEYDNFANAVAMGHQTQRQARYETLMYGEGELKTLFKAVKWAASGNGLDRYFITGVSPMVLSDATSGFNNAKQVSLDPQLHDLCGFTEAEMSQAVHQVAAECNLPDKLADQAIATMRTFYDGYRFHRRQIAGIYNPTLSLYFLDAFRSTGEFPQNLLDTNLAMDQDKLRWVTALLGNDDILLTLANDDLGFGVSYLSDRFGIQELLSHDEDKAALGALLFYFGVATLHGQTAAGEMRLCIPNLVIRRLYFETLQRHLLPQVSLRNERIDLAKALYQFGEIEPVCQFAEQRLFKAFKNRDYRRQNAEAMVKTAFLTLLFNDIQYTPESETELHRRYADITLILRPEYRNSQLNDIVIEFKYVALSVAKTTAAQVRNMSQAQIQAIPAIANALDEATRAAHDYRHELLARHNGMLKLRVFVVAALGFERLAWREIEITA
ncbi:MAG: AAA family ATPase [Anaerolineae bacterium]|nr:AAA family ATPase [Anaerolineae bacterium]